MTLTEALALLRRYRAHPHVYDDPQYALALAVRLVLAARAHPTA